LAYSIPPQAVGKLEDLPHLKYQLVTAMLKVSKRQKIVLFFDEFPWMATKRSGLLSALEYFWNRHWTHDPRLKLIICGSSASWIIEKIVNNKGGLHNRVTRTMILEPLNLHDTKAYLADFGNKLNDLYMVLGGIPHYLSLVEKGLSAQQQFPAGIAGGVSTTDKNKETNISCDDYERWIETIKAL